MWPSAFKGNRKEARVKDYDDWTFEGPVWSERMREQMLFVDVDLVLMSMFHDVPSFFLRVAVRPS